MRSARASILLVVCFMAFMACEREEPEAPLMPASLVLRNEGAVDELANASCDYQELCGNIDVRAKYTSREHCMNVMRSDAASELDQCEGREVNPRKLRECLFDIRRVDCENPFNRFEQREACEGDSLCD